MTKMERSWSEDQFKDLYKGSADVSIEPCYFQSDSTPTVLLIYVNGLCDSIRIQEVVLPELIRFYETQTLVVPSLDPLKAKLSLVSFLDVPTIDEIDESIFEGDLFLFFVNEYRFYRMHLNSVPKRPPEESSTEISIKGPKDGFTEDITTSVALIRKRIRSHSLHVEEFVIGKRTKTKVALLYFTDIINPKILAEVKTRLTSIVTDGLYSINQLEEALTGSKLKILPLIEYTGRTDFCVNALLAGRFVLVLDGNPMVLVGPAGLSLILKSPEDIHFNYTYISFARVIRIFSLFLSVFLPAVWVALMAFHQDQLPFRIMATIAVSRLGLPFSSQIEMFILLMLLEIFREAGIRLPNAIGQTLTSIGGLIIGDAAIRAGLVSPSVVVVGAITAICSVTLVNQSLSSVSSILRFFFFFLACFLGMYGVILGIVLFVAYMASQRSFGVSYLAPLSPLLLKTVFQSFLRVPWEMLRRRPTSIRTQDDDR